VLLVDFILLCSKQIKTKYVYFSSLTMPDAVMVISNDVFFIFCCSFGALFLFKGPTHEINVVYLGFLF